MLLRTILAISIMALPATVLACAPILHGKEVKLTAECAVSKVPDAVYVMIGNKKYKVDLPMEFQNKFGAGDRAWIGLIGVCRDEQIGGPQTSESADGSIKVSKILFFDQNEGHKNSVQVLK